MNKKEAIGIVSRSIKQFDENLKNRNIMFIIENEDREIDYLEVFFPTSCFYHLTGLNVYNKNNKKLNSYEFYKLAKVKGLDESKLEFKYRTTFYKLEILLQLMAIDKNAKIIGHFHDGNLYLQSDKLVGNVNFCIGMIESDKIKNMYIPNTALKEDIRRITTNRGRVVAVLKKEMYEELYTKITYLKKNYDVKKILENSNVKKRIDFKNLYFYNKDNLVNTKLVEQLKKHKKETN